MGQFTPGPWTAIPDARDNGEWEVVKHDDHKPNAEDPWYICGVYDAAEHADAADNARLIAAAPDLLAALISAESLFAHTFAMDGTIHKQMRAAIARAKGE